VSHPVAALALVALLGAQKTTPLEAGPPRTDTAAGPEVAPGTVAGKESVAALIRRSMDAYGGSRAQVRLGCVRVTGNARSPLHPDEAGRVIRIFARSNRLRLEVAYPGSAPEVRILDGPRAFRYGEPASAAVAAMLQLQAARLDLPALLEEWEPRVEDLGEVAHEGQQLRVLGLEIAAGVKLEAGLEPRTGRILYVRGLAGNGPRPLEVFTVYRDFREVDGVLFPFREEGWANGEPTGEVEISQVEFLDEPPEKAFEP